MCLTCLSISQANQIENCAYHNSGTLGIWKARQCISVFISDNLSLKWLLEWRHWKWFVKKYFLKTKRKILIWNIRNWSFLVLSIHAFSDPQVKDTGAVFEKHVGERIGYCHRELYSFVVVGFSFKLFKPICLCCHLSLMIIRRAFPSKQIEQDKCMKLSLLLSPHYFTWSCVSKDTIIQTYTCKDRHRMHIPMCTLNENK